MLLRKLAGCCALFLFLIPTVATSTLGPLELSSARASYVPATTDDVFPSNGRLLILDLFPDVQVDVYVREGRDDGGEGWEPLAVQQHPETEHFTVPLAALAGRDRTRLLIAYADRNEDLSVEVSSTEDNAPPQLLDEPTVFMETDGVSSYTADGCTTDVEVLLPGASDDFGVAFASVYNGDRILSPQMIAPDATSVYVTFTTSNGGSALAQGTQCVAVTYTDWAGNESVPVEACDFNSVASGCPPAG